MSYEVAWYSTSASAATVTINTTPNVVPINELENVSNKIAIHVAITRSTETAKHSETRVTTPRGGGVLLYMPCVISGTSGSNAFASLTNRVLFQVIIMQAGWDSGTDHLNTGWHAVSWTISDNATAVGKSGGGGDGPSSTTAGGTGAVTAPPPTKGGAVATPPAAATLAVDVRFELGVMGMQLSLMRCAADAAAEAMLQRYEVMSREWLTDTQNLNARHRALEQLQAGMKRKIDSGDLIVLKRARSGDNHARVVVCDGNANGTVRYSIDTHRPVVRTGSATYISCGSIKEDYSDLSINEDNFDPLDLTVLLDEQMQESVPLAAGMLVRQGQTVQSIKRHILTVGQSLDGYISTGRHLKRFDPASMVSRLLRSAVSILMTPADSETRYHTFVFKGTKLFHHEVFSDTTKNIDIPLASGQTHTMNPWGDEYTKTALVNIDAAVDSEYTVIPVQSTSSHVTVELGGVPDLITTGKTFEVRTNHKVYEDGILCTTQQESKKAVGPDDHLSSAQLTNLIPEADYERTIKRTLLENAIKASCTYANEWTTAWSSALDDDEEDDDDEDADVEEGDADEEEIFDYSVNANLQSTFSTISLGTDAGCVILAKTFNSRYADFITATDASKQRDASFQQRLRDFMSKKDPHDINAFDQLLKDFKAATEKFDGYTNLRTSQSGTGSIVYANPVVGKSGSKPHGDPAFFSTRLLEQSSEIPRAIETATALLEHKVGGELAVDVMQAIANLDAGIRKTMREKPFVWLTPAPAYLAETLPESAHYKCIRFDTSISPDKWFAGCSPSTRIDAFETALVIVNSKRPKGVSVDTPTQIVLDNTMCSDMIDFFGGWHETAADGSGTTALACVPLSTLQSSDARHLDEPTNEFYKYLMRAQTLTVQGRVTKHLFVAPLLVQTMGPTTNAAATTCVVEDYAQLQPRYYELANIIISHCQYQAKSMILLKDGALAKVLSLGELVEPWQESTLYNTRTFQHVVDMLVAAFVAMQHSKDAGAKFRDKVGQAAANDTLTSTVRRFCSSMNVPLKKKAPLST